MRFSVPIRSAAILVLALLVWGGANVHPVHAVACSSGAAAQNGITVVPSHGSAFYIDTGVMPVLDAGYAGYRVTNGTGSSQSTLWTEVSGFTGGVVALANAADSMMKLPTLANAATGTSYFMLKAKSATTAAQGHTLKVYDDRPDLAGASVLYECDFSFSKVQETIKAAANKLADNGLTSAAAIEVSDTSPELGQLVTITVEGQTGQIGAGSTPDFDIIWLAPAAVSTWPTRALRLEDVSITFDGNGNWASTGDQVTYDDQLLIPDANGLANVDNSEYRISYGFRVAGQPTSTVTAVPVAQISSGTQIKHSDTGATGGTLDISFSSLTINAALTKSVTVTTGLVTEDCSGACSVPGGAGNGTYVAVPYRLTAASTTATTLTVDDFVDQAPSGVIFKPGSATVTDIGRTGVAISDPVTVVADAAPKPLHFVGPFTLNSGTNATVDYTMWIPVGSFANTAYAMIGDLLIGATSSAMSRITVTSTGTGTVGVVTDTADFSVDAVTDPATSIASTAATINGTVDPNGTAVLTGQFQYGTSPTLAGATTVTATTPASGNLNGLTVPTAVSYGLTGLSSGTTYYYRVIAGSAQGSILSFTTLAVLANPTPTTTEATSVATTTATLNGTINPNLTAITGIQFLYGTVSDLSSGVTTLTVDDGSGLAALTAGGSTAQPFSYDVTGLTATTTYYFKIRACTSALTGTYPNVSCATNFDGSILSFTPGLAARTLTIDGGSYDPSYSAVDVPPTITSTASAGVGAKSYTSVTPGVCTIDSGTGVVTFVSAGTCTIDADIAADGTYVAADATDISFDVTLAARTLAIDAGSYEASYSLTDAEPTITSTPSAGAGLKSYSSVTPGVCSIDFSTGTVTFVAAGTCTIDADIAPDGTYAAADAVDVSFDLTLASRTLTIDAGSYDASYGITDAPPTITSTASAGVGVKSYSSVTPGVCAIDEATGVAAFVSAGTCTIDADIATDGTYAAADAVDVSFELTLASRTLAIDGGSYAASYSLTDAEPTITSTPSAGVGAKSYTSVTPGVCTIDSGTGAVTFVAAGTCTIDADIATDGTYAAADALDVSFEITLASRTLTIDAASYEASYSLIDAPPTITSTPSAGVGAKTFSSLTLAVCTIDESTGVVAFVAAGTCTIDADIGSDGTYAAADAVDVSFELTLASRTLSIDGGSYEVGYALTDAPPTIASTPSAGVGAISYSSLTPDVCTIDEETGDVSFESAGTCTIGSEIASDGTYDAAVADEVSFELTLASRTLDIDAESYGPTYAMTAEPPTITSTASAGEGTKTYSGLTPAVCTIDESTGAVTFVSAGTCTIDAAVSSDGTYDVADAEAISFVITAVSSGGGPSPVSPSGPSISINAGAACSSTGEVTLTLGATNATHVLLANEPQFLGVSWASFSSSSPTRTWTLASGDGEKTVYALFKNGALSTAVASDSIELDLAGACGEPDADDPEVVSDEDTDEAADEESDDETVPDTTDDDEPADSSETPATAGPPEPTVCACDSAALDLYIVNPDGTERHPGDGFVRVDRQADGTARYSFEDKGADMDFNDFLIDVDARDCSRVAFAAAAINAGWHHVVRLAYVDPSGVRQDVVVWQDSQTSVGASASVGVAVTCPPPIPPQACDSAAFDLYIVNPDGTERHPGSGFVRADSRVDGTARYQFEDKGADMDFNDFLVDADATDCANATFAAIAINAGWHHVVRLAHMDVFDIPRDDVVWQDSHASVGNPRSFAVRPPVSIPAPVPAPAAGPSCAITEQILARRGDTGPQIAVLQEALGCRGFFPATVVPNGIFGPITEGAVIAFQTSVGLSPTGIVDATTSAELARP